MEVNLAVISTTKISRNLHDMQNALYVSNS